MTPAIVIEGRRIIIAGKQDLSTPTRSRTQSSSMRCALRIPLAGPMLDTYIGMKWELVDILRNLWYNVFRNSQRNDQ